MQLPVGRRAHPLAPEVAVKGGPVQREPLQRQVGASPHQPIQLEAPVAGRELDLVAEERGRLRRVDERGEGLAQ